MLKNSLFDTLRAVQVKYLFLLCFNPTIWYKNNNKVNNILMCCRHKQTPVSKSHYRLFGKGQSSRNTGDMPREALECYKMSFNTTSFSAPAKAPVNSASTHLYHYGQGSESDKVQICRDPEGEKKKNGKGILGLQQSLFLHTSSSRPAMVPVSLDVHLYPPFRRLFRMNFIWNKYAVTPQMTRGSSLPPYPFLSPFISSFLLFPFLFCFPFVVSYKINLFFPSCCEVLDISVRESL